jgi:hypothetical protein
MATTKVKVETKTERLYECEVKRRRVRASGNGYEPFWKLKNVQEALGDGDTEFRCKDCHGAVKLHKKHIATGPASHAEHRLKGDSEYCVAGWYFKKAEDGRESRLSGTPVV